MTGLAVSMGHPIYLGGGTTSQVPDIWDVAIGGRTYMIDWAYVKTDNFVHQSVSLLRPQSDDGDQFSEASLNPEEFVRRSAESWHLGAGQTHHDKEESSPFRFLASKGIDCWTKWQASLLNGTVLRFDDQFNDNIFVVTVGTELWAVTGSVVNRSTDNGLTWSAVAGYSPVSHSAIVSDGFNVWVASASSGIYAGVRGTGSVASYATGQVDMIGYAKGRLMASRANAVYNITAAGAFPTALFTHNNTDFRWVGFAEGHSVIYAAGFSGDKSYIYRVTIKSDGTALDPATFVVAGALPDGEVVRSIQGYLGFLLIGSDDGIRFAQADDNGDLTLGALIRTPGPVLCFEPQDRFVWFGWTNYDSTSTGLGRLDLSNFTGPLTPAYASDLMFTGQGAVTSIATVGTKRMFTVARRGIVAETDTKVPSGTLDSGHISYGIPDDKVAMYLDVRHQPLRGTVSASIAPDYSTSFLLLGTSAVADSTAIILAAGETRGQVFAVRLTLNATGDLSAGPVVSRWTLESNPAPGRGSYITIPLLFFEHVETHAGPATQDVRALFQELLGIEAVGKPTTFQAITGNYVVFLDDHKFIPEKRNKSLSFYDGTMVVRLRQPRQRS